MEKDEKKLFLRITIAKSNPQMIREVTVNADLSCKELVALVFLVYGVPVGTAVLKNEKMEVIEEAESVDRVFSNGDTLIFEFLNMADGREFSGTAWIELLDTEEEGERLQLPEVSYANGYQLLPVEASVERMNRYYLLWEHGQTVYLGVGGASNGSNYSFCRKDVYHQLQLYFAPESLEHRLDASMKMRLSDILSFCDTERLRGLLVRTGMPTFPQQEREALIENLNRQYTEDFFRRLLCGCTLWELLNIRTFCRKKELMLDRGGVRESLPTLFENELVYIAPDGRMFLAEEFMAVWEDWQTRIETEHFFAQRMMQYVILGSCELYGYVTGELAREVFSHCYPGEQWAKGTYEALRQRILTAGRLVELKEGYLYDGLVYGTSPKARMELEKRIAIAEALPTGRFLPTAELLENLALHGSAFEEGQEARLRAFFAEEAGVQAKNYAALLKRLLFGMKQGLLVSGLVDIVREYSRQGLQADTEQRAAALLCEVGKDVRGLELKGYTARELENGDEE